MLVGRPRRPSKPASPPISHRFSDMSFDDFCDLVWSFVLPETQNRPSESFEGAVVSGIPLFITRQLRGPIARWILRNAAMAWASVPETAINKYSHPFFPKDKVSGTPESWLRTSVSSVSQASAVHRRPDSILDFRSGLIPLHHPSDGWGARWRGGRNKTPLTDLHAWKVARFLQSNLYPSKRGHSDCAPSRNRGMRPTRFELATFGLKRTRVIPPGVRFSGRT